MNKDIVLMRLESDQSARIQEEELREVKWVSPAELLDHMNFHGQRELYAKVLKEFEL